MCTCSHFCVEATQRKERIGLFLIIFFRRPHFFLDTNRNNSIFEISNIFTECEKPSLQFTPCYWENVLLSTSSAEHYISVMVLSEGLLLPLMLVLLYFFEQAFFSLFFLSTPPRDCCLISFLIFTKSPLF